MASTKYIRTARKLQTACKKMFGVKLLIDQRQWYNQNRDQVVTAYTLYQMLDANKVKLFQTYSQIQLVLFLRDYYFKLNGWEIPTDNEIWEEIKRKYAERNEPSDREPTVVGDGNIATDCDRTTVCGELYKSWKRSGGSEDDIGVEELETP